MPLRPGCSHDGPPGTTCSAAIGAPDNAAAQIRAFVERTGADELMITCNMHDHAARMRSYEIAAGLMAPVA